MAHRQINGLRVGLVTNDAATTAFLPRPLLPVRRTLQQASVQLCALLSPEQGMRQVYLLYH